MIFLLCNYFQKPFDIALFPQTLKQLGVLILGFLLDEIINSYASEIMFMFSEKLLFKIIKCSKAM